MADHTLGRIALESCIEGDYESARKVIEGMSIFDLKALRHGCTDLGHEIDCLVETVGDV